MKRFICAFLTLPLAVSLCGCGGNRGSSDMLDDSSVESFDETKESGKDFPDESSTGFGSTEVSSDDKPEILKPDDMMYTPETEFGFVKIDSGIKIIKYFGEGGAVNIPDNILGYPVVEIGDCAFEYCDGLTSLTIPDSVTSIGAGAFTNCEGLTSITIPDGVTSIERMTFYGCTNLTSITIPDSVTSIGDFAFDDCPGISFSYKGQTYDYSSLDELYTSNKIEGSKPDSITVYTPETEFGVVKVDGGIEIIEYFGEGGTVDIPDNIEGYPVIKIGYRAFYQHNDITSITIPDGITSIESGAFSCCGRLKSITIPDSVTSIGSYAFFGCNLNSITIPDSVTYIGEYAFAGGLTENIYFINISYKGQDYNCFQLDDLYAAINGG